MVVGAAASGRRSPTRSSARTSRDAGGGSTCALVTYRGRDIQWWMDDGLNDERYDG
jgi:hypothetical protein